MPKTETVLKVFAASPHDVAEEREVLEEIVSGLNVSWADTHGIRLDLVRWETHVVPGVGDNVQDVINEQISDSYDIFLGIMWTRFGTPTQQASSGTEEEFLRAYNRYQKNHNSVDIMFYFKTTPISPMNIDLDQLQAISKFRSRLKELGCLYYEFNSIDEFRNSITRHLGMTVPKWKKRLENSSIVESVPAHREIVDVTEDNLIGEEEGFVDLIESVHDSISNVNEILVRMKEATQDFSSEIHQRTEEAKELSVSSNSQNLKSVKRMAANAARDLNNYVARMRVEIPLYSQSFTSAMVSFSQAATLITDFEIDNVDNLQILLNNTAALRLGISQSREHFQDFRTAIKQLPRMTTVFNHARRDTIAMMDEFHDELNASERQVHDVENLLSELIKQH